MNQMLRLSLTLLLAFIATACMQAPAPPSIIVALVADGRERTFSYTERVTVDEFLRDAEITLGELDSVNPPPYTQIDDGLRVTVVRIQEESYCEDTPIPFVRRTVLNEGLAPGEERLGQTGQNGTLQTCYRVQVRDGITRDPVETSRTTLSVAQDEIVYVGPSGQIDPVVIDGTIAYLSNGNAWMMRGSSTTKRPLTDSGDLDGRTFSLSANGRQLIYTRRTLNTVDNPNAFNRMWMLPEVTLDRPAVQLLPENVLAGGWVPGQENTLSYSTGEARNTAPGWQAYNDLWTMRVDPGTGETLSVRELVERSSGGLYGWWGTTFQWSNDGTRLAWVHADAIGTVDLETGELLPLLNYPVFNTFQQPWSWRSTVSWSPDNSRVLTTIHGAPIGSEPAETSPAFHVAAADTEATFQANIVINAGIWANPKYAPTSTDESGRIAYLRCRDFPNCVSDSAQYDLMIADLDGSNPRRVFPSADQPGLTQRDFVWSPSGEQIALIYAGNLWIVGVDTGISQQLTLDGGASRPVWTQ
jgi:hypothetical protein